MWKGIGEEAMTERDEANGCASQDDPRRQTRRRRDANLAQIGRVVAVMSGKGGVGKSTVGAAIALGLAQLGRRVGLLDVDFHGPSIPTLLGLVGRQPASAYGGLCPVELGSDLKVMSLGFLLGGADEAVIWRGPMKIGVIDQLLGDVSWGGLDFLIVDCPPGTGDEALSIGQVIPNAEVVMVGTPQEVAMADVRKAVAFCLKLGLRLLGLVETMGTIRCTHCGAEVPLFARAKASRPLGVPLLAKVPFDPDLQAACDEGRLAAFLAAGGTTARRLLDLAEYVACGHGPGLAAATGVQTENKVPQEKGSQSMRYAMPTADGALVMHFGHADRFTFVDVNEGVIGAVREASPPPHAPGVLPAWCKENGVDIVIAGGMGSRAQSLFAARGIQVVVGAPAEAPEELVRRHLSGTLAPGTNVCDH